MEYDKNDNYVEFLDCHELIFIWFVEIFTKIVIIENSDSEWPFHENRKIHKNVNAL